MTEKEFYEWIGQKIQRYREKLDMKQPQIAKKVGISQSYLSRIERGQKCSTYLLNKILGTMGLTLADLIDDEKKKISPLRFQVNL